MLGCTTTVIGSPGLYVAGVQPIAVMTLMDEASIVHVPIVDASAAFAPTVSTIWLCGFCHRYSSTTPRSVMFLLMLNTAREW